MRDQIRITTPDGSFMAHVAQPQAIPSPAIVVIHEVFGVNADMRQSCDELAAQGYLAICPDLFWRMEPGVDAEAAALTNGRTEAFLALHLKNSERLFCASQTGAGVCR